MLQHLTIATASAHLASFEDEAFTEFSHLAIRGRNAWQMIKVPLFFEEIKSSNKSVDTQIKVNNKYLNFINSTVTLTKVISKTFFSKNAGWFITKSISKNVMTKDGVYYNNLMYPLIELFGKRNSIILEIPLNGAIRLPEAIPHDYSMAFVNDLTALIYKVYPFKKDVLKVSEKIFELYFHFCEKNNIKTTASKHFFYRCIMFYIAQSLIFDFIFYIAKPKFIISDQMTENGLTLATSKHKVRLIELQHGNIDKYYPLYTWSSKYTSISQKIEFYKVAVFGNLSKKIIEFNSYFTSKNVYLLGSNRIDLLRSKVDNMANRTQTVGVLLQTYCHDLNINIIRSLQNSDLSSINFIVKPHPAQPKDEIIEYQSMVEGFGNFYFASEKQDIVMIIQSIDLMISYVSTSLDEMISVGKPAITVTSEEWPLGIHSMTGETILEKAIIPCPPPAIPSLISRFYHDDLFREAWIDEVKAVQYEVFCEDYQQRAKELFKILEND